MTNDCLPFPSRSRHGKTIPNPKSRLSLAEGSPVPLVACPKCATNLKIPDGSSGNVKCPKCGTIFPVAAKPAAAPAFEVVEDTPAPTPAARPQPLEPDFEVVDEPKPKKKVVALDEEDDDRPRGKRRRDYDDDEDDDRPKKKKKRRDYDNEDDDWQPVANRGAFGAAKVGMLMVSISLWMYLSTFALMAFFLLIAWIGASIPAGLMIVTGLLGLANWVVGLIGLGFCIAGPSKSRGLAIAATAVAAVHLVMAFVVANNAKSAFYGFHTVAMLSAMNKAERFMDIMKKMEKETDPKRREALQKELRDLSEAERGGSSIGFDEARGRRTDDMRWQDLSTLMPYSDVLIAVLSYQSKGFSDYVLALLSGLLEVARLVLIVLLIGAVARAARAHDAADKSLMATFFAGGATLIAMIVIVLVAVILDNSDKTSVKSLDEAQKAAKSLLTWAVLGELLVYAIHIGSLVLPAVLSLQAKNAAARKAR